MSEQRTGQYEGMFLISQGQAADLSGVVDHLHGILTKHGASILAMRKWDDRRLAFEIDKQKRGYYILTYFEAPTEALTKITRDCNLSERIMRQMIINADHLERDELLAHDARGDLEVEAKLRAEQAAEQAEAESKVAVTVGAPEMDAGKDDESGDESDED